MSDAETLWCESCGEAPVGVRLEHAALCPGCLAETVLAAAEETGDRYTAVPVHGPAGAIGVLLILDPGPEPEDEDEDGGDPITFLSDRWLEYHGPDGDHGAATWCDTLARLLDVPLPGCTEAVSTKLVFCVRSEGRLGALIEIEADATPTPPIVPGAEISVLPKGSPHSFDGCAALRAFIPAESVSRVHVETVARVLLRHIEGDPTCPAT